MTKQGRMKQTLYVDDSIVWLKKAQNFLLKIRKKNIDTKNHCFKNRTDPAGPTGSQSSPVKTLKTSQ